jgi:hypothetical protein
VVSHPRQLNLDKTFTSANYQAETKIMDFVKLLNQTVPDAGDYAQKTILDAQKRLEMLRVKNPQEAEVYSQQLASAISRQEDPSLVLEGIGKSYGMSIGKPSTRDESVQPQETAKKEAYKAAAIAEINSMAKQSEKSGNVVDYSLVDSIRNLAAQGDPDKAREMAKSTLQILEQKPEDKAPKKTTADITFEQNAASAMRFTNQLADAIKKYGTFELASPEGSAKLGQLPYQMAIAYAKTVDPSSVAREGEVAAAQKYLIPMGIGTRNETALFAAEEFKKDIEERVRQYKKSTGSEMSIEGIDTKTEKKEDTVGGANSFFDKFK